ncbi:LLM class flavin-dependent oxidoreductase [Streptomyces lasiicapitis]|uniref:LLM class flavin-dependent oxidoreductase n=1 Tax=Streptomyces lasiicapitis TaxID=1923961 RepID=UPI00369E8124
MRVGVVILPAQSWRESAPYWRAVDEMGFDHAWTHDHLAWRDLLDKPWFAALPTLTAAAAVTERMRLGTLVCTPNYRHPVTLAKEAVALDDISEGRMILGIGAGVDGPDARVLGDPAVDTRTRMARFAEFTELTDRLLRQDVTDFAGNWYVAEGARMFSGCRQRPRLPLAVAATGPRAMRVAARHADVWITNGTSPKPGLHAAVVDTDIVREQLERFDEVCAETGRDPSAVARLVYHGDRTHSALRSVDAFAELAGRYAESGVTDLVVPFPRAEPPHQADPAVLERIATDVLPALQARANRTEG